MKLPNAHLALVERDEITEYLLNLAHRYGASKARFFAALGFRLGDWETLAEALREHGQQHEVGIVTGRVPPPWSDHPNYLNPFRTRRFPAPNPAWRRHFDFEAEMRPVGSGGVAQHRGAVQVLHVPVPRPRAEFLLDALNE